MFNFIELNQNVLYMAESVRHSLKNKTSDSNDKPIKFLRSALRICLQCNDKQDETTLKQIKSNIFFYLLSNHSGHKLLVPSPPLSFDCIMNLAIDCQLDDLFEVTGSNNDFKSFSFIFIKLPVFSFKIFEKFNAETKSALVEKLTIYVVNKTHQPDSIEFFTSFLLFSAIQLLSLNFVKRNNTQLNQIETQLLTLLETSCQSADRVTFKPNDVNEILLKVLKHIIAALDFNGLNKTSPEATTQQLTSRFEANIKEIEYSIHLLFNLIPNRLNFGEKHLLSSI